MPIVYTLVVLFVIYSIWERRTEKGKEFKKDYDNWKKENDI